VKSFRIFCKQTLSKYFLFMFITVRCVSLACVSVDRRYVFTVLGQEKARSYLQGPIVTLYVNAGVWSVMY